MVAVRRLVKPLPRRDRDRQPVLLRGQGTRGIGSYGARRIVSPIEIEHNLSICDRTSLQKTPARIGISLCRQVVENEKKPLRRIAAEIGQLHFLTVDLEHPLPATRIALTSPKTLGTSMVVFPSDGAQVAAIW